MKDELFLRGAQVPMTKEAVRALALAKLELHRARHLIDIGAGTGSVSIEAALQNPALRVTAIERQADALRLLQENLHSALAHLRQSGIHEVDCQQLAVSTLATLGSGHYFKPHNPVFVIACQKEENHG